MAWFIDTNIFVACLRRPDSGLRDRLMEHSPKEIMVPYQVLAELRVGAVKSARSRHNLEKVNLLLRPFAIAWPDLVVVEHYVEIRSDLEKAGLVISEADLWIAAIARASSGILVTHNAAEFKRVPRLSIEDWLSEI